MSFTGILGIHLDTEANTLNQACVSTSQSLPVLVLPADEEEQMRWLSHTLLSTLSA